MHSLKVGQKPPAGSMVTLYRDNGMSPLPTAVEWFYADDVPDWTCPVTTNGFFYAYETREEKPGCLRAMAIKLNNLMPDDLRNSLEFRQAVCTCLAAEATPTAELARALRAADWAVRECAPWALKLAADCAESSGREADAASMRASAEKLIAHALVNDAVSAKSAADAAYDAYDDAADRAVAYVDDNDAYADGAAAYTDGHDSYADDADNAIRAAADAAHAAARAADRASAADAAYDAYANDAYANDAAKTADAAADAARAAADAAAMAADAAEAAARAAAAKAAADAGDDYAARAAAARAADDAIWHGAIKLFAELVSIKG